MEGKCLSVGRGTTCQRPSLFCLDNIREKLKTRCKHMFCVTFRHIFENYKKNLSQKQQTGEKCPFHTLFLSQVGFNKQRDKFLFSC